MNVDVAFPSKWIRAVDLNGRDYDLTIARCSQEDINSDGCDLPVLHFHATKKGLILNKTNANTIAAALGKEMNAWVGQTIVLFPTTTDFGGKRVDCIRVRPPQLAAAAVVAPVEPAPVTSPPTDEEIPF